jgi:hypothetical protein
MGGKLLALLVERVDLLLADLLTCRSDWALRRLPLSEARVGEQARPEGNRAYLLHGGLDFHEQSIADSREWRRLSTGLGEGLLGEMGW